MRWTAFLFAALSLSVLLLSGVQADDTKGSKGKEVTLKGTITCAKCDLGTEKVCTTVIVVVENKKDVVLYFDPAGHKKHHGKICQASAKGTVTGVVKDDGKRKVIEVKDVKFE